MDTGVLVSGLYWLNEAHQCLRAWEQGAYHLVVSDAVFEEYQRVARRVREHEGLSGDPEPMLRLIREHALWVVPDPLDRPVCRDPKDDKFIEAALAGGAKLVIARDADLTDLEKPFGVEMVTPRQFLSRLPRQMRRRLGKA